MTLEEIDIALKEALKTDKGRSILLAAEQRLRSRKRKSERLCRVNGCKRQHEDDSMRLCGQHWSGVQAILEMFYIMGLEAIGSGLDGDLLSNRLDDSDAFNIECRKFVQLRGRSWLAEIQDWLASDGLGAAIATGARPMPQQRHRAAAA